MEKETKICTLAIARQDGQVLLGMKKRGFGEGKWNGFGGKIEAGETVEEATRREMLEESGVTVEKMEKIGRLHFTFPHNDNPDFDVHIFSVSEFNGEPVEGDEMRPAWFVESEIPLDLMWADDAHWMPYFLAGQHFCGEFSFDNDNNIIDHSLRKASLGEL